jgi:hypothetical protein
MLEETGLEAWIAERNEEYGRFSVRVLSNSVRNDIWKDLPDAFLLRSCTLQMYP